MLKRGRSAAFADPDLTAIDARHVWLPEGHKTTLLSLARRSGSQDSVFFPELPSLEHPLVEASGRQNMVLRSNRTSLQFPVEGDDLAAGPSGSRRPAIASPQHVAPPYATHPITQARPRRITAGSSQPGVFCRALSCDVWLDPFDVRASTLGIWLACVVVDLASSTAFEALFGTPQPATFTTEGRRAANAGTV